MELTVMEFQEKYLPELEQQFQDRTQQYISNHRIDIFKKCQNQMEKFVLFMGQFQELLPVEVGEIQISLMHTSVHLKKPQFAVCAYDENGIFGNEIFNVRFNADWLFTEWDDYRKQIVDKIDSLNAQNCIREEAVTQMMWYSMAYLQDCLYITLKYHLRYFWTMKGYDHLILSDKFRMTVGGYRDSSKIVFMKTDEVDLFLCNPKDDLIYHQFYEAVYNKKNFKKLDLSATYFKNCEFVHCTFEDIHFLDAEFDECRFYHCTFENVDFSGVTFEDSTIKKCIFSNTAWNYNPENGVYKDIYKNVELIHSVMESVKFEKSNLCGIIPADSKIDDCEIIECEHDGTVFNEVE